MAIRYIINKENRTVVAVMENCECDAVMAANAWTGWTNLKVVNNVEVNISLMNKYLMPNKFIGIARCSVNDIWDEDTGVKIAQERVLHKYHKSFNKAIRKINADIQAQAEHFNNRVQKLRDER